EIQQVLGDGFMCVFGLRETTGDEADRAVLAGLAMGATRGTAVGRPSVHAGVECGEVFVTPSWPPAGYGVWGRAVNLAQRLCALAGPGELRFGPGAYARAGRRARRARGGAGAPPGPARTSPGSRASASRWSATASWSTASDRRQSPLW